MNTYARILLVEDEPTIARITKRLLESAGYALPPVVATTLDAGLTCTQARFPDTDRGFDVVITDLYLGQDSGLEIVRLCLDRGIPVVLSTAMPCDVPRWVHEAGVLVVDKLELRAQLTIATSLALESRKEHAA